MKWTRSNPSDDLLGVDWFRPLSPAARRSAARHADWCTVRPGTRLQRQGAHTRWVWVVVDGMVEVRRDGELLGLVSPGGAIGEVELLLGAPSPVDVVAASDATVVSLPAAAFHGLFEEPSFAASVAKRLAGECQSARVTETVSSSPSA